MLVTTIVLWKQMQAGLYSRALCQRPLWGNDHVDKKVTSKSAFDCSTPWLLASDNILKRSSTCTVHLPIWWSNSQRNRPLDSLSALLSFATKIFQCCVACNIVACMAQVHACGENASSWRSCMWRQGRAQKKAAAGAQCPARRHPCLRAWHTGVTCEHNDAVCLRLDVAPGLHKTCAALHVIICLFLKHAATQASAATTAQQRAA